MTRKLRRFALESSKTSFTAFAALALSTALLALTTLSACQHKPAVSETPPAESLYGTFTKPEAEALVIVVPQWHLSPQTDTKTEQHSIPQTENQQAIYHQLVAWGTAGTVQNVLLEGCEGEITDAYGERFNGWTLQDLKQSSEKEFDAAITHVGLKLRVKLGDKLRLVCGDNLALIKKHQLVLSDLRGLSGFKIRLTQFKNEEAKRKDYLETLRSLFKRPKASDDEVVAALDQKLREAVAQFEKLIQERNTSFLTALRKLTGRSAIVIGALHEADLESRLGKDGTKFAVFTPRGLRGDEGDLLIQIKKLLGQ